MRVTAVEPLLTWCPYSYILSYTWTISDWYSYSKTCVYLYTPHHEQTLAARREIHEHNVCHETLWWLCNEEKDKVYDRERQSTKPKVWWMIVPWLIPQVFARPHPDITCYGEPSLLRRASTLALHHTPNFNPRCTIHSAPQQSWQCTYLCCATKVSA